MVKTAKYAAAKTHEQLHLCEEPKRPQPSSTRLESLDLHLPSSAEWRLKCGVSLTTVLGQARNDVDSVTPVISAGSTAASS